AEVIPLLFRNGREPRQISILCFDGGRIAGDEYFRMSRQREVGFDDDGTVACRFRLQPLRGWRGLDACAPDHRGGRQEALLELHTVRGDVLHGAVEQHGYAALHQRAARVVANLAWETREHFTACFDEHNLHERTIDVP